VPQTPRRVTGFLPEEPTLPGWMSAGEAIEFAKKVLAGKEPQTHLTRLHDFDVFGSHYGRSGSFVQHLIDLL
jgi:ABC-type multidrug transport system ATPase subunit